MVYPNGESLERAVYVWGNTVEEILDNSTAKLGMWQKARLIYTMEGKLVSRKSFVCRYTTVEISVLI